MVCSHNNVKVDLSALRGNVALVRSLLRPETKIMGVVKSDAYGHGLVPVSRALEGEGIHCLGVAYLEEAVELRRNGIRSPVVLLCGIRGREDAKAVIEGDFIPVLFDLESAALLAEECARAHRRGKVHLKVDTGMGRLGVPHAEVGTFLRRVMDFRTLTIEGLTSHLSSADERSTEFTKLQIEHFRKAVVTGRVMGLDLPLNNLANSAGVMGHKDSHFEMVRPGIMLYGGLPSPDFEGAVPLQAVMGFSGRILQVRDLPPETPVSYGRTYSTHGPRRVAVLSAGYGDGLPRSLSNKGKVLISGRRCDILGRVCMNMVICDVTEIEGTTPGDEAVFLGSQGGETITGDDIARWGGTISYEVFCSIGRRVTREYIP